jgi:hypothetical protein
MRKVYGMGLVDSNPVILQHVCPICFVLTFNERVIPVCRLPDGVDLTDDGLGPGAFDKLTVCTYTLQPTGQSNGGMTWRIRLVAQDSALSRHRHGFESRMRYHMQAAS